MKEPRWPQTLTSFKSHRPRTPPLKSHQLKNFNNYVSYYALCSYRINANNRHETAFRSLLLFFFTSKRLMAATVSVSYDTAPVSVHAGGADAVLRVVGTIPVRHRWVCCTLGTVGDAICPADGGFCVCAPMGPRTGWVLRYYNGRPCSGTDYDGTSSVPGKWIANQWFFRRCQRRFWLTHESVWPGTGSSLNDFLQNKLLEEI